MPFNNPNIPPPSVSEPFVDDDGVLTPENVSWILTNLIPAIAQSPSVFKSTGPVFNETATDALALDDLPLGDISNGAYRVTAYVRVNSPDGVASSVTPFVSFVDRVSGVTCQSMGIANTSDAIDEPNSSTIVIDVRSPGPISIGTLYSSTTPNAMEYHIEAWVERLQ